MGVVQSVRTLLAELRSVYDRYNRLKARIDADPGIPVSNPTRSFWMHPLVTLPAPTDELPQHADVVIIGSGITAASIARTLLAESPDLTVVVLDARDACGGATGRNGGHMKPYLYEEYGIIKKKFGTEIAQKTIRFRQMHLPETIKVAEEEGVLESCGAREVESLDVHYHADVFEEYKQRFLEWRQDSPKESARFEIYEAEEARSKFHLADHCQGAIVGPAGAIHPYRLITAIWKRLTAEHPDNFFLFTHTPVNAVQAASKFNGLYTVQTPRGVIVTPHVVHATNAHTSHLLPRMRGKIIPTRATCTAQRPGQSSSPSTLDGGRSWLLYHKRGYDYLTQLPDSRELVLGGGFMRGEDDEGLGDIGLADDSAYDPMVVAYLGGALPAWFGERNWGAEAADSDDGSSGDDGWNAGRLKAAWCGILSISADGHPWVGRVPEKIAQRPSPTPTAKWSTRTAAPGEWISAGYSGDGMAAALLSGRAVAYMILDREDEFKVKDWLPEPLLITPKRWAKAKVEDRLSEAWAHRGQGNAKN
ncbi:nucleotide-binding domain-containing protein [Exidia glandulosa HHB12029]|uniref:Nucleotide-binding domain-containing protein n=1 Tax=Exidia glandulosa HHB12029 TaxID=1314781 RepID=A0A165F438_EXIGL|nr:nucleotide-binding domain-containing protein [Exidia glandulosa HHB12029]